MNILAQIPTADQLESFVNAEELTVWDFVWAAMAEPASCGRSPAEPPPETLVFEFGDNATQFQLLFWHDPQVLDGYRAVDSVARAVARSLAREGIVIAFPQRTLWWGDPDRRAEIPGL